jgi:hypothetical protein
MSKPVKRPLLSTYARYLSLRMCIFVVALLVVTLVGLRGLLGVIVALLISGVASYPLARRQRDAIVREMNRKP